MSQDASVTADAPSISMRLREATARAHEQAENAPFVVELLDGQRDVEDYRRLAAQLFVVYRALESVGDDLAGDPLAAAVLDPALCRVPGLTADLAALGVDPGEVEPLESVRAYAAAIEDSRADPVRFIAHHYTRYLGDLSGGQVVAHRMRRHYGLGEDTLNFYRFDGIDKLKRYKDAYRDRLDALPLDPDGTERLVAEAISAFDFNQRLFAGLDAR